MGSHYIGSARWRAVGGILVRWGREKEGGTTHTPPHVSKNMLCCGSRRTVRSQALVCQGHTASLGTSGPPPPTLAADLEHKHELGQRCPRHLQLERSVREADREGWVKVGVKQKVWMFAPLKCFLLMSHVLSSHARGDAGGAVARQ